MAYDPKSYTQPTNSYVYSSRNTTNTGYPFNSNNVTNVNNVTNPVNPFAGNTLMNNNNNSQIWKHTNNLSTNNTTTPNIFSNTGSNSNIRMTSSVTATTPNIFSNTNSNNLFNNTQQNQPSVNIFSSNNQQSTTPNLFSQSSVFQQQPQNNSHNLFASNPQPQNMFQSAVGPSNSSYQTPNLFANSNQSMYSGYPPIKQPGLFDSPNSYYAQSMYNSQMFMPPLEIPKRKTIFSSTRLDEEGRPIDPTASNKNFMETYAPNLYQSQANPATFIRMM